MKTILGFTMVAIALISASCRSKCHSTFQLENVSGNSVIVARPEFTVDSVTLTGETVPQGEAYVFPAKSSKGCIEQDLILIDHYVLYVLDPNQSYTLNQTIHRDSLESFNTILKEVIVTEEALEASDYKLTYP